MSKKKRVFFPESSTDKKEIELFAQIYIEDNFTYVKSKATLPYQGWKIHVSGNIHNYKEILNQVSNICIENQVSFKFINNEEDVINCFAKGNSPLSTGKFITIYPSNENTFKNLIEIIHQETKNFNGASIVTNRQYKDNNILYYRYGVITDTSDRKNSNIRPKLFDNEGKSYEDIKGPFFSLPPFVNDIIIEENEATISTGKVTLNKGKYEIDKILKISNSGNIYVGNNTNTHEKIVIKEARHDIHTNGVDIKKLLENEIRILKKINSVYLPRYIDHFYFEGNTYLVEEFIEGMTLEDIEIEFNLPYEKFIEKKLIDKEKITNKIITAMNKLHKLGLIIDDVSPQNILYSNGRIVFIDFETSYLIDEEPILRTTNKLFRDFKFNGTGIEKDNQKLAYTLINLLTKASELLKFDSSGQKTINLFITTCLEHNFDHKLMTKILHMLGYKGDTKRDYQEFSGRNGDVLLELNQLNDFKDSLINTLINNNLSAIKVKGNILNHYLTNKYYSLKRNIKYTLDTGHDSSHNEQTNDYQNLLNIKVKSCEGDFEVTRAFIINFSTIKKSKSIVELIMFLSIINDYLENKFLDLDVMDIFEKTIEFIKSSRLQRQQGKLSVKYKDGYFSPYMSSGNSGLTVELIRYSKIIGSNKYNSLITDLSAMLNVSYAKDTGFANGLAGIGYANLSLFKYFNDYRYLFNTLEICKKLTMYNVYFEGDAYLCNPSLDNISFDFFNGITGQIFLLDQTSSQLQEVLKNETIFKKL